MFYALKALLIAVASLPVLIFILSVAPFDRKGKMAYALGRLWTGTALRVGGVSIRVRGLEYLDPTKAYVFMANHQSNVDIPALMEALPDHQLRWIAKKELLWIPVFGWGLWASRHVIVDRKDQSSAMAGFRRARAKVEAGISVVVFPEGTRGPGGELLPFKRGGFVLASRTGAPIVPVVLRGSNAILPKGDWRLRSGEIEVILNKPITLGTDFGGTLGQLIDQVRRIMESSLTGTAESVGGSQTLSGCMEKRSGGY